MNILIPHSWLLEHLDTQATPDQIQEKVSLCGPSIERIYDRNGESVYDIEVTTNRVDSMSVRGIARETAVILEEFGIRAKLKPLNTTKPEQSTKHALPLPNIVNNQNLCSRITCIVLQDVERTPTPQWMADRLLQIDQQIHDSVVDITNYITHDLGHPCHAFDYDKVMALGGDIIVTEAEKGKSFTTLDGNTYEAVGGEVVFENAEGTIIDLPAIKGTANSSIDADTKNVLLWIEHIDPQKVRFASMTHAIRTVAAQLSEKNVDSNLGELVIFEGTRLYQELCSAQVASQVFDEGAEAVQCPSVSIPLSTIDAYIGLEIDLEKIQKILTDLECEITLSSDSQDRKKISLTVTPPSFRPDIRIPADIVEEIARIYGYHQLPSTLMETALPTTRPTNTDFVVEHKIKQFLATVGLQEVYTYSMVSEVIASQSGFQLNEHLKLQNPLSDDRVYLRRSLVPSLAEVLDSNPQAKDLSVFEIANVYHPKDTGLPSEELELTILTQLPYRKSRGILESLLNQWFVSNMQIEQTSDSESAIITVLKEKIGNISIIEKNRVAITISLPQLLQVIHSHPEYIPLPKAESVVEDLTFTLPAQTAVGPLLDLISSSHELISSVELTDVYQHNHTFSITYLDPSKSLSNQEVEPIRKEVVAQLAKHFQAELVGSLQS